MLWTSIASISRPFVLGTAMLLAVGACSRDSEHWNSPDISGIGIPRLNFTLVDANGMTVTAQDFRDKVTLLYFGYTHCPDVCPTTLTKLSRAVTSLGNDSRSVRILFVTVDPERDTGAVLRRYTRSFGPEIIGLRGTQTHLRELTGRYRVTYGYGKPDKEGNYEVSHSSAVFVFDRKGHARLLIDSSESAKAIESDLRKLLVQS